MKMMKCTTINNNYWNEYKCSIYSFLVYAAATLIYLAPFRFNLNLLGTPIVVPVAHLHYIVRRNWSILPGRASVCAGQ